MNLQHTWYSCSILACIAQAAQFSRMEELYKAKLSIDKNIPPSDTIDFELKITAKLSMLIGFDEVEDKLSTVILFTFRWTDDRYSWNKDNTSSIHADLKKYITINDDLVWRPIPLIQRDKTGGSARIDKINGVIYIQPDGTFLWIFSQSLDTYCEADTTFYPFDIQQCLIELSFPDYPNMNVSVNREKSVLSEGGSQNGNWKISKYDIYLKNKYLRLELQLHRKPLRPVLTLILPVFILDFMTPLVFLMPKEAGERIGLSLTLLLAISVYMTIIGDNLPKVSDPISVINVALFVWFISNACIVLVVIMINSIYKKDNTKPVPSSLQKFVHVLNQCLFRGQRDTSDDRKQHSSCFCRSNTCLCSSMMGNSRTNKQSTTDTQGSGCLCLRRRCSNVFENTNETNEDTRIDTPDELTAEVANINWEDLGNALDTMCCVITYTLKLVFIVILFWYLVNGSQQHYNEKINAMSSKTFEIEHEDHDYDYYYSFDGYFDYYNSVMYVLNIPDLAGSDSNITDLAGSDSNITDLDSSDLIMTGMIENDVNITDMMESDLIISGMMENNSGVLGMMKNDLNITDMMENDLNITDIL